MKKEDIITKLDSIIKESNDLIKETSDFTTLYKLTGIRYDATELKERLLRYGTI